MVLEIPPDNVAVTFRTPKPKTDVNWEKNIEVFPSWAKAENVTLKTGLYNLTFTAKHPISKLTISCSTVITVLGI